MPSLSVSANCAESLQRNWSEASPTFTPRTARAKGRGSGRPFTRALAERRGLIALHRFAIAASALFNRAPFVASTIEMYAILPSTQSSKCSRPSRFCAARPVNFA